jgi:hypothetical protein
MPNLDIVVDVSTATPVYTVVGYIRRAKRDKGKTGQIRVDRGKVNVHFFLYLFILT